ncbi:MAG TPA: TetR/AcrR family transcriptional regulator, partial [Turneriella sp.]|nr:TetR/AcrR family transcriptional regulator [Turneriella sp.]
MKSFFTMAICKKKQQVPETKTRDTILAAAVEEFAQNGFAGARTENIAKAANVNKAMLHYYFQDKETLYDAVLDTLYAWLLETETLTQEVAITPMNSVQFVHLFLKIVVHKHANPHNEAFRRILAWELAAGQNNFKRVAQKYIVPRILQLKQVLEVGIANGELQCKNPILTLYSMVSQVVFYYMHRYTYEDTPIHDELYSNVTPNYFLSFLLENFIACY